MTPAEALWDRIYREAPDDFDEEEYDKYLDSLDSTVYRGNPDWSSQWRDRDELNNWNWFNPNLKTPPMPDVNEVLNEPIRKEWQKPPMPRMQKTIFGTEVPVSVPKPNDKWVFTGTDEKDVKADWYLKGEPIPESIAGPGTYKKLSQAMNPVFSSEHHGKYLGSGRPTSMSERSALEHETALKGINPPGFSNTEDKNPMQVYNNWKEYEARTGQLQKNVLEEQQRIQNLKEANQLRQERLGVQPFQQNLNQNTGWWQNSNLNPANQTSPNNPMRVDGSQVNNAEASNLRQWGQQNLNRQSSTLAARNAVGTGSNPMTVNNMPGAARAVPAIEGAAAGGGTMGLMGRAMPMINLALMTKSLLDSSKARIDQEKELEQKRRMRA